MFKKSISILICICFLFNASYSAFAAYSVTDAMKILGSMDVISGDGDGNLRENDLVKRSEFAKMAVLLSQYKNEVSIGSKISVFTDCTWTHWAAPYVVVAAKYGIIEGYLDGRFGPDDYINYAQAVTIALRLLGYTDEDFGYSYPEGQLGVANSLKLNLGVNKSYDDLLTRGDVSVILINMLLTNAKNSSDSYIDSLGYTILQDTVVISTNDENSAVMPGKVYTSNGEYTIDNSFDTTFVGKKGSVVTNSDSKFITLLEGEVKSKPYTLMSVGEEYISVHDGSATKNITVDSGTVCYDGTAKLNFSALKSSLKIGDMLSIGTDADGNVDYIIAGKSDLEGAYTVLNDGTLPVDGDYESYSIIRNGNTSSLSQIKKNDIIYISPSLSAVYAYSKKISGVYQKAIPNIDSPKSVVVGGTEYNLEEPAAFSKLASNGIYSIGDTVVLLIGKDSGIADVITEGSDSIMSYASELKSYENIMPPEYAVLENLGSINLDGTEISGGDQNVTRAEFAKMAVQISKYRSLVSLGSRVSVFSDCTSSFWATPYIKVACENGLMSAYSDSMFYPLNGVSLAEAADTSLKILGYSDSDFSDWPSAQLSLAKSKGITEGIDKSSYDMLTKDEATLLLYNTLCSTAKNSNQKGIETLGYKYYEDSVIIATNAQNSSVPAGKVLTSNGTFSVDTLSFDSSLVGKSGQLLVYSDKVQMFNKNSALYIEEYVYSAIPGGVAVMKDDDVSLIDIPEGTTLYVNAETTSFSSQNDLIAPGDTAYVCYDDMNRIKYVYIDSGTMKGPYAVNDSASWYVNIPGASDKSRIIKNGANITSAQLEKNDIIYYSQGLDTVFCYSDKVIGIFESAYPSIDNPSSITVSGTSYSLETADSFKLNASLGDTVVLCLGRNGKVAHSISSENMNIVGYLVSSGVKEFINQNGEKYTSLYAGLVLPDGTKIDCATDGDYSKFINSVMSIKFSGPKATLGKINSGGVYGKVDADKFTLGSFKLSQNLKILDVGYTDYDEATIYTSVFLQRLDKMTLSQSDVLYSKSENGYVTEMILKNVTGDAFSYGIVTSANTVLNQNQASGSYVCDISGSSYSYSGGAHTQISAGSTVKVALSGGKINNISKIGVHYTNVKEVDYTSVTLSNGTKLYLSDKVAVYKQTGNYKYTSLPISDIVEGLANYTYISVVADSSQSKGSRVRVIIVR